MKDHPVYKKYLREHATTHHLDRHIIKRLLSYLSPYKAYMFLAITLLVIARVIEALVPIFIGYTTQKIIDGAYASEFNKESLLSYILEACLIIIGMLFCGYLLDATSVIIKSHVGQKAVYSMRTKVYDHIQKLSMSYYDHHAVGRLMTRTIHDVEQINQMFTESVIPILGNIILFICIFAGIFFIDWRIGIAFAFLLPIVAVLTNRFRYYQRYCYDMVRNIVAAMNTFVQEHLLGASTIRNFGIQKREKLQFDEINLDHCTANIETIHHFAFFISAIDFLQSFSLILVFAVLVAFSPSGTGFQVGKYFTFSLYALMFFRPLSDLAERYNVLQSSMSAAERIFTILDRPTENYNSEGRKLENVRTITFEDVWFAYEKENWILKGLSFELHEGESLALVGITGSGKTTVISLLMRFYDFQKGSIKINGYNIKEYSLHSLREQFSVVLQDPVIFSGTLYDNITLYRPDISVERVNTVIDYVNLTDLVKKLPQGIFFPLGERGQTLSAGERQLVSLARAVAHERSILVLDEATANIDTVTEQLIQDVLQKILSQKTAIVIAHRLSTIRDVTRILVINNGVVAESGTHSELLQQKGIYEKLYRVQFQAEI